jgi:hypothetical protein
MTNKQHSTSLAATALVDLLLLVVIVVVAWMIFGA